MKEGVLDVTELDRFDIANYKFVLRRLAKGNRFARFFYGGDDVPVADLSEGKLHQEDKDTVEAAEALLREERTSRGGGEKNDLATLR